MEAAAASAWASYTRCAGVVPHATGVAWRALAEEDRHAAEAGEPGRDVDALFRSNAGMRSRFGESPSPLWRVTLHLVPCDGR